MRLTIRGNDMNVTLPPEIVAHLLMLAEEDIDANEDHMQWLVAHPDEEDRDIQMAECERSIELDRQTMEYLK
jgi:hypothetical protein